MKSATKSRLKTDSISGETTQSAQELGVYESACCNQEVVFDRNDCFSRCPNCEERCVWELVESVISTTQLSEWLELEEESHFPARRAGNAA